MPLTWAFRCGGDESACRRVSVRWSEDHVGGHPSQRPTRGHWTGSPTSAWPCSGWGLQAARVAPDAGALLPHLFTLACDRRTVHRRCVFCCTFRRLTTPGYRPAPCPTETRPSSTRSNRAAATQPTHHQAPTVARRRHKWLNIGSRMNLSGCQPSSRERRDDEKRPPITPPRVPSDVARNMMNTSDSHGAASLPLKRRMA